MHFIHQIWFEFGHTDNNQINRITLERKTLKERIERHCTNFKYKLWSFEDARNLIEERYPEYMAFFDCKTNRPIIKCDFFRYVLLHAFGGFYLDLDFFVLKSLDGLLDEFPSTILLTRESHNSIELHNTLHNGFMFSKDSGLQFWKILCDSVVTQQTSKNMLSLSEQDVYRFTGTKFLCSKWLEYKNQFQITILPFEKACNHWFVDKNNKKLFYSEENSSVVRDPSLSWSFLTVDDAIKERVRLVKCGSHVVCIVMNHGSYWK